MIFGVCIGVCAHHPVPRDFCDDASGRYAVDVFIALDVRLLTHIDVYPQRVDHKHIGFDRKRLVSLFHGEFNRIQNIDIINDRIFDDTDAERDGFGCNRIIQLFARLLRKLF
ncbi:hypothetical protein SDC9_212242 [bioreactor metagenome]|uniref:Uncharacterized protein n=1 Tax=bioreactor metagenome TaxID=1076179 RepID=A0A645JMA0_9ZZZZ